MQYTYNTKLTTFEWLASVVAVHERFHAFVEHVRENRPFWVDWYPVQSRILDGSAGESSHPLVMDIGAGSGRDMLAFSKKFPDAAGRVIIQGLPSVFDDVHYHDLGLRRLDTMSSLLSRSKVRARTYFLKFVLHEFSDQNCIEKKNTIPAMEKGHSKILIGKYILSDENAGLFNSMVDLILMVFAPGTLRTK
ncbi:S-adenosyl-L-methionine-dependent methyltransferase [Penicillium angulare]|uniref:S-adenosyl-L-methionine-dependent methyltransferase n=1 Tax=Penicillium angulare TaxID=116970 RepID=UPI0025421C66|nr:S-adenosyl-L-methionine-dependent methyltransferase [Penicillium angulare]KAJ5289155.1 S-adenosyl-L-methionine-dependent methyltransferase [Penicillium angulare]